MKPKCLVCAEQHTTEQCPKRIDKERLRHLQDSNIIVDRSFVKCANCGAAHTANYRGCSKRADYEKAMQNVATRNLKNNTRPSARNNFNLSSSNFPPLSSNHYTPQQPSARRTTDTYSNITRNDTNLFTSHQLINIMKTMMSRMRHCRTKEDQILVMADIVTTYVYPCP